MKAKLSLDGRVSVNLKRIREKKNLTQEEVARKARTAGAYVSMLEAGLRSASIPMAERLANALGVDPAELFKEV